MSSQLPRHRHELEYPSRHHELQLPRHHQECDFAIAIMHIGSVAFASSRRHGPLWRAPGLGPIPLTLTRLLMREVGGRHYSIACARADVDAFG